MTLEFKMTPKYTVSEAIGVAIAVASRALEDNRTLVCEVRELARQVRELALKPSGWDHYHEELRDGGRWLFTRYTRGDMVNEFTHKTAMPVYRGVFQNGRNYDRGDNVTWSGSTWTALKDTGTKPETNNSDWQMSNKRGHDGKVVVSVPRDPSTPVKINGPAHS